MKYLVLFVVVIVGLMVIKKSQREKEAALRRARQPKPLPPPEPMLACTRCGVHTPRSRCVWRDGKPYCSEDHARLGA